MDQIIQFHIDHDYIIKAQRLIGNAVVVTYPERVVINPATEKIVSFLSQDGILKFRDFDYDDLNNIRVNNFAHRPLILSDIICKADAREMSTRLFVVYDIAGECLGVEAAHILDSLPNDEESKKEEELTNLFVRLCLGTEDFETAEKVGIENEYLLLVRTMNNGGLECLV